MLRTITRIFILSATALIIAAALACDTTNEHANPQQSKPAQQKPQPPEETRPIEPTAESPTAQPQTPDSGNVTGKIQQQSEPAHQPHQPPADAQQIKPTADRPIAQPQTPDAHKADPKFHEQMRWCKAWALDNLKPVTYTEFLRLNPRTMDDIDRTIWRDRIRDDQCSQLYGSEPLNAGNADKRNEQFRNECLGNLVHEADYQWERLADAAYERNNPTAHEIPNQYVRIMRWMHLSGEELLGMDEPPHKFLERLSEYDYASEANRYVNIPNAQSVMNAQDKHGDNFSIDWWGLHVAATNNNASKIEGCSEYFPQFFYGRWIPEAQPPGETPTPKPEQQRALDVYNAEIQRVLDSSLYLPRP